MERFAPIAHGRVMRKSRVAVNRGVPTVQPNFPAVRAQNPTRYQYTDEERKNMVFWTRDFGATQAQQRWIQEYGEGHVPSISTFTRNYNKFDEKGTVQNQNKFVERRRTVRTPEKIAEVRDALLAEHANPAAMKGSSARRNDFGISRSSFNRITREDLEFNAYKKGKEHKHNFLRDPQARRIFCEWMEMNIAADEHFLDHIIMSDECAFTLGGNVNSQTDRRYSAQGEGRPDEFYHVQPEDQTKLHVWIGVIGSGIKIPIKIYRGSLNGQRYKRILSHHLMPFLRDAVPEEIRERLHFQQDGAPCHREEGVKRYLRSQFGDRLIGLGFNDPENGFHGVDYPARSPDLTVLDIWLNNRIKSHVYVHPMPTTLEELEAKIIAVYNAITPEEIRNAFQGLKERFRQCILRNGGLFEKNRKIRDA